MTPSASTPEKANAESSADICDPISSSATCGDAEISKLYCVISVCFGSNGHLVFIEVDQPIFIQIDTLPTPMD